MINKIELKQLFCCLSLPKKKKVAACLFLIFLSSSIYFGIQSIQKYNQTEDFISTLAEEQNIRLDIIRLTASDGVSLKAYFLAQPETWNATANNVSLIVLLHGQNTDAWNYLGVGYSLVQRGYAVLLPEMRGHGSNIAPATYGSIEPWDIISFMDLLESDPQFDFLNITNSGIHGGSMGGYMATSTYLFETIGKCRFKALSEIAGPTNLSRGVDLLTPDRFKFLGNVPFNQNLTGKNPINYVIQNPQLYHNILIQHGDQDESVDYQCSVDFYNALDPTHTRDDIKFYTFNGMGHGITKNKDALINMTIWFERILRGKIYVPTEIEFQSMDFDGLIKPGELFYQSLQIAIFMFALALISIIYGRSISYFDTPIPSPESSKQPEETHSNASRLYYIGILFIFYLMAGVLTWILDLSFIFEYIFTVLASLFAFILIYKKMAPDQRDFVKKWLNIRLAMLWIISLGIAVVIYYYFASLTLLEDSLLIKRERFTGYLFYFMLVFTLQNCIIGLFSRSLVYQINYKPTKKLLNIFLSPIIVSIITFLSIIFFQIGSLDSIIHGVLLNMTLNDIYIIPLLALVMGAIGFIIELISQIIEYIFPFLRSNVILPYLISIFLGRFLFITQFHLI